MFRAKPMPLRMVLLCAALAATGCSGSRWARDDLDYARKYPQHSDDMLQTTKQAVDARHVHGKHGFYAGFAGREEPRGAGAEAGVFMYPRSWMETRVGGAILAHDGDKPLSGGALAGVRVQPPTRLAPFVGLGGYVGWSGFRDASMDGLDNDGDGLVDEWGEYDLEFVVAVVPEAGVHYWINSRLRLTASADYRLASDGRDADALYYGVSLALLGRGQSSPPKGCGDSGDWTFGDDDAWKDAAAPTGPAPTLPPP
ncbi:MAG TPA: hypothetical protein PJ982_13485, partial [Lacipirellulaceae bacterium]|nr:hypothetical protein [Lacipirellulaceae bacterium]